MEIKELPWGVIAQVSVSHGLNPLWVGAMIMTESGGERLSMRYEPHYKYLYHPRDFSQKLGITVETEEVLQKSSFGLTQFMGAVAREFGFNGLLPELFNIEKNIEYGCRALKKHYQNYGNIHDSIASYNAGSVRKTPGGFYENQKHVDRFDIWLRKVEAQAKT